MISVTVFSLTSDRLKLIATILCGSWLMIMASVSVGEENDAAERGVKKKKNLTSPATTTQSDASVPTVKEPVLPEPGKPDQANTTLGNTEKATVSRIVLRGNTILTAAEVNNIVRPHLGSMNMEQLQSIRQALSKLYIDKGYINSGVIIPDQSVKQETVIMQAVEGELTEIEIFGQQRLSTSYIKNRLTSEVRKPLQIQTLQESLQLLQQDPLIAQVNAQLNPGNAPGKSVLSLRVKERNPYLLRASIDNHRSPSVGSEKLELNGGYRNLFGGGEAIALQLALTTGIKNYGLNYQHPLTRKGATLEAFYHYSDAIVVEEPFDRIDIASESSQYGLRWQYPLQKSLRRSLVLSTALELKHNASSLLQQPFSFSLGAINGETNVTILSVGLAWLERRPQQVWSIHTGIRWGVNALDATENKGKIPDGEFLSWQGQGQYVHVLPWWQSQFITKSMAQLSINPLLSLEKFALGGISTVRGYRENQFVRDNGVVVSCEWRLPLEKKSQLHLISFIDSGYAWDTDQVSKTEAENLSSIGLGMTWQPSRGFSTEIFAAARLEKVAKSDQANLQDSGIHFKLQYQHPF